MKIDVELGGKTRTVELTRTEDGLRFSMDGRLVKANAVEVASGSYSILIGGESFEIRVEPSGLNLRISIAGREFLAAIRDPRKSWLTGGTIQAEGRQEVIAPMPGKVIRLLVGLGDAVEVGQGIVVVEAMKMQNEVRSPKSGTIERLQVAEGQAVSAGDTLAVIA
jgi:biotin carboxyl carrier protein